MASLLIQIIIITACFTCIIPQNKQFMNICNVLFLDNDHDTGFNNIERRTESNSQASLIPTECCLKRPLPQRALVKSVLHVEYQLNTSAGIKSEL